MKRIIAALTTGIVMPLIDTTVVNLVLKQIADNLNTDISEAQWIVSAYALASALGVILSGWLSKRFGAKRIWIAGLFLFLVGSLLAIPALRISTLIAARCIQGLAAGLLMTTMFSIARHAVPCTAFRIAMARLAIPAVLAPIAAPLLGGWLIRFGWPAIFAVNIPVSLAALVLAWGITPVPVQPCGFQLLDMAVFRRDTGVFLWILWLASALLFGGLFLIPLLFARLPTGHISLLLTVQACGALFLRSFFNPLTNRFGYAKPGMFAGLAAMAGTCVLLHEQMDALLLAGLFLRGGAIGLLTLQAMTAALESMPKYLAADAGMLARISTMLGGAAAVLVCAHLAPAAAVCFLIFAALAATASFSAVWRK